MDGKTEKLDSYEKLNNPERSANTAASASASSASRSGYSAKTDSKKKYSVATIVIACVAVVALVLCAWSMSQYVNGKDPLAFVNGSSSAEVVSSDSTTSSAATASNDKSVSSASSDEGSDSSNGSSEQAVDGSNELESDRVEDLQSGDSASKGNVGQTLETPSAVDEPVSDSEQQPAQSNEIAVNITIDGTAAGSNAASGTVYLSRGATAYDALLASGASVNARNSAFGMYVAAINGLAEKEHGANSGWLYSVNGVEPQTSCSNMQLSDGDTVVWHYTVG